MWEMYPQRFVALLEHLLTDGMSESDKDDWDAEMREDEPSVDMDNPMLQELVKLRQASTISDAAELMALTERMATAQAAGKEDKVAELQAAMTKIRADAMNAQT